MNMIKFSSAVSIDKGLIRSNNEDNFYLNGKFLTADDRELANTFSLDPSNELQIYGVFDGMGGEALGEVASFLSAQVLEKYHKRILLNDLDIKETILSSIEDANAIICKKIVESGEKRIGSTFSVIAINNDKATVFNVGDSRVYLLRDGQLRQVSVDDTLAQRLVNLGLITLEKAKTHKDRHKLTQHLGIFCDEMIIEPHVAQDIAIKKDDKFLLCSDGLTDMLDDEEIHEILCKNKSCTELSQELVNAALKNGGYDNVTAVVISADSKRKKRFINKNSFN